MPRAAGCGAESLHGEAHEIGADDDWAGESPLCLFPGRRDVGAR